jgi:hypothetical protein
MNTNTESSNMTFGEHWRQLREKSGATRFDNLQHKFDNLPHSGYNEVEALIQLLKYTADPDIYNAPIKQEFNNMLDATGAKKRVLAIATKFATIARYLRAIANDTTDMNTLATAANNLRDDIKIDTSEKQSLMQHLQHIADKHL